MQKMGKSTMRDHHNLHSFCKKKNLIMSKMQFVYFIPMVNEFLYSFVKHSFAGTSGKREDSFGTESIYVVLCTEQKFYTQGI